MPGPSDLEQLLLEYVNSARLDPVRDAARYVTSYATLASPDAAVANALKAFGVNGAVLQSAYQALTPVQPLAWNDSLGNAARSHDQAMITGRDQQHQFAGEATLGGRATAAGYAGWNTVGENISAYASSPLHAHASFMVDWGSGANGMQSPASHRANIMSATFREVGIGIVGEATSANPVGPLVVTEDFGTRSASGSFVLGVAYTDHDGNNFYSPGEGRADLQVKVGSAVATSMDSGGFQLGGGGSGARTIALNGGGLSGTVSVQLAATSSNVKIDVVNGATLKLSASATISGPVTGAEALSALGQSLTILGSDSHRLVGGSGADVLTGDAGHDVLIGGGGSDTLIGGAGNDHLYGQSANGGPDGPDVLLGGDGGDYLQGNAGGDRMDGGTGNDRLYGGADNDDLRGGTGNDQINGNLGDDLLSGGGDNDVVRGGQGNDWVYGDDGDDTLWGDLGADTVEGGTGIDRLTGGAEADLFRFSAGDAAFGGGATDVILDYARGVDHIALGFRVASVLTGAAQSSVATAATLASALLAGHSGGNEVAAIAIGSDTLLFFAGSGTGAVDSAIRLAGIAPGTITSADFI